MATFETPAGRPVPAVTADEMREVDRVAVEDVGLPLLSMMENAGRNLARVARDLLGDGSAPSPSETRGDEGQGAGGEGQGAPVAVLAGAGGNGGGGLSAARHLLNRDVPIRVVVDRPPTDLSGAPATHLDVLDAAGVPVVDGSADTAAAEAVVADAPLVVDALVGYGLTDALRGTAADLVAATDGARVLSLDVPSGVNATTGETPGVAATPACTCTLALPKPGLAHVPGELALADIAIPAAVFERAGVDYAPPFDDDYLVPLRRA